MGGRLVELLAFVRCPFGHAGAAVHTHPDEGVARDLEALERAGKVRRVREWPDGRVAWLPVEG